LNLIKNNLTANCRYSTKNAFQPHNICNRFALAHRQKAWLCVTRRRRCGAMLLIDPELFPPDRFGPALDSILSGLVCCADCDRRCRGEFIPMHNRATIFMRGRAQVPFQE